MREKQEVDDTDLWLPSIQLFRNKNTPCILIPLGIRIPRVFLQRPGS